MREKERKRKEIMFMLVVIIGFFIKTLSNLNES